MSSKTKIKSPKALVVAILGTAYLVFLASMLYQSWEIYRYNTNLSSQLLPLIGAVSSFIIFSVVYWFRLKSKKSIIEKLFVPLIAMVVQMMFLLGSSIVSTHTVGRIDGYVTHWIAYDVAFSAAGTLLGVCVVLRYRAYLTQA